MKRINKFLLCLLMVAMILGSFLPGSPAANEGLAFGAQGLSRDLAKAHENNSQGVPIHQNQVVSVQGIVTVEEGVFHDNANYFTITTAKEDYRFSGGIAVYLPGSNNLNLNVGDKVVVTGTLSNQGYPSDKGTTVICPSSAAGIKKISSGHTSPDPFPLFSDFTYEKVEEFLGQRFEGMMVRVVGQIHNFDNLGTVQGFSVDGSENGNLADGLGSINVKFYDYSGIDVSSLKDGDLVAVSGILFQNKSVAPFTSGYYLRPTKTEDISQISENTSLTLSEISRKDENGNGILAGKTVKAVGIATVSSGMWNSSSNSFSIISSPHVPGMDPIYPKGGVNVYKAGNLTPLVEEGDKVEVVGTVDNNGYDKGLVDITPTTISVLSKGNDLLAEEVIRSDWGFSRLKEVESRPVKLQGRVYNIDKVGVTQGFDLDASDDHNWTDKQGMISVKFYSYGGVDISNLVEGELLIVRGVLQKFDETQPYDSGYFIRPRNSADIVKRSDNTKRTVYIQLDAFRNDYVKRNDWNTPNFDSLIDTGARCTNSYGEFVSMTTANMTTLVTGSHTSTHQVPALAFYDKTADRRVRHLQNYDVATIGEVFQEEGLLTASVLQRRLQDRGADFMIDGGTTAETRADAVRVISEEAPDLLLVLFNSTDGTAHKFGTDSTQMREAVEEIDSAIGAIKEALRANGTLDDTTFVIASDHGSDKVENNVTSNLIDALQNSGLICENAALDMGPFQEDTEVVYNLASAAAQIYFRKELTAAKIQMLTNALSSIEGVTVYDRGQLDQLNTSQNLGDLVVDCHKGYAFSTSYADHGSMAQRHTFLVFNGPQIKNNVSYTENCETVDIVPSIYFIHGLTAPETVDGQILTDIFKQAN